MFLPLETSELKSKDSGIFFTDNFLVIFTEKNGFLKANVKNTAFAKLNQMNTYCNEICKTCSP